MSDDAATEWLTVCATDVRHLPASVLSRAAKEAGKTCTHHGQIIPAILGSQDVKTWEAGERLVRSMTDTAYLGMARKLPDNRPPEVRELAGNVAKQLRG